MTAAALLCLPLTGEFEIAANGLYPAIARDSAGDTVIAWQSFGSNPSATLTYVQLYDASGNSRGAPILVNSSSDYSGPVQVAMDAAGDFVVTWAQGAMPSNWSNTAGAVYAQRYAANGTAQGSAINVGSVWLNRGYVPRPAVAMNAGGDFDVTWANDKLLFEVLGSPLWANSKVYSRLFAASGTPRTGAFIVDTALTHSLLGECADVSMDAAGNFAVVWTSYQLPHPLTSDISQTIWVRAQRYDATGKARGAHMLVEQYDNSAVSVHGLLGCAYVAMDSQGDFGISSSLVTQTVTARIYAADGTLRAGPIAVTTTSTTNPVAVKGAMDNAGNFLVPWAIAGAVSKIPAYGQYYGLDGTPEGSSINFATDVEASAYFSVAVDGQGKAAAVWMDFQDAIQGQFFTGP